MPAYDIWMIQYATVARKINADYERQNNQNSNGLKPPIEGL